MAKDFVVLRADPIERTRLTRAWPRCRLAKEAGLSIAAVSSAASGRPVTLRTASAVAGALGLDVSTLVVLPDAAVG